MLTHFIDKGVIWKQSVWGGESSITVGWVFVSISCEIKSLRIEII